MKKTILATLVGSVILSGCFFDSDDPASVSKEVQAYDPAIFGITSTFECEDGSKGTTAKSDVKGLVYIDAPTFVSAPETCSIEFGPTAGAKDMSNGKDLSKAVYSAPKGLFSADAPAAATPLSTLIAKTLEAQGVEEYDESTALEVMKDLGLDAIFNNNNISVADLLTAPEATIAKLPAKDLTVVSATNTVLSDALVAQPNKPVADIAKVTKVIAEDVVAKNPDYPKGNNGEDVVYVDVGDVLGDDAIFEEVVKVDDPKDLPSDITDKTDKPTVGEPVDPEDPTGGTGGTGGDGGVGDGNG
ncbi:hypothetical protein [Thaumasiovibrio sp. DFM-14]|uniref:hypothetical protein n=1 Tax=Thaumasiovibrio sp. DFM-14 TaxID=3384792 RepID=UPI00399FDA14